MVAKDPLKIYIVKRHDAFGFFISLYQENHLGERAVAVDMEMEDYRPGQVVPESSSFPVDEDSLRELGKYLIGQGLITAPVTDRERNEHEQLKIEYEGLKKAHEEMSKAFDETNKTLDRITASLQAMVEKHK